MKYLKFVNLLPLLVTSAFLSANEANFGGPSAVENQISADNEDRQIPTKESLAEKGVELGLDYSAIGLSADKAFPGSDDQAASGMARFYGSWAALNHNESNVGALVWKIEHRHSYTDTSVKNFEFGTGGLGLITPAFSDEKTRLTNLYWRQKMSDGKGTVIAGFMDVTDYVDVYAAASPWTGFMNFSFSTGTNTMALPSDATFGLAAGHMLTDELFLIAGISDMEADPTEPFKSAENFFNKRRYFKSVELGWTSSQQQIYLNNVHLTLWDSDESDFLNQAADRGFNVSASHLFGSWLPFVRYGYAKDGSLLGITQSLSTGFSYYGLGAPKNNFGFAVNWADAGTNQYTFEAFYLMKLSDHFELTPDIQLIKDPALNPDESQIWIAGLRARLLW
ncbi:carbohydrate porin [Agarivorans sp. JK6]|uniref:carbohydrate porin n=1 Tax=Agarivorans sp. JK6 TaxID=2997426 RepID=UPI003872FB41